MVNDPKKLEHEDLVKKLDRYAKALPDELGVQPVRNYFNARIQEMNRMTDKNTYTKAVMLSKSHRYCITLWSHDLNIMI